MSRIGKRMLLEVRDDPIVIDQTDLLGKRDRSLGPIEPYDFEVLRFFATAEELSIVLHDLLRADVLQPLLAPVIVEFGTWSCRA